MEAQSHWELLGNSIEQTLKLRVAPGLLTAPHFQAALAPAATEGPPGRETADAGDKKPLACIGTTSVKGLLAEHQEHRIHCKLEGRDLVTGDYRTSVGSKPNQG